MDRVKRSLLVIVAVRQRQLDRVKRSLLVIVAVRQRQLDRVKRSLLDYHGDNQLYSNV